jgi:hypothetical protein
MDDTPVTLTFEKLEEIVSSYGCLSSVVLEEVNTARAAVKSKI